MWVEKPLFVQHGRQFENHVFRGMGVAQANKIATEHLILTEVLSLTRISFCVCSSFQVGAEPF